MVWKAPGIEPMARVICPAGSVGDPPLTCSRGSFPIGGCTVGELPQGP